MKGRGWAWVLAGAVALSVPAIVSADDRGHGRDGWDRGGYGRDDGQAYQRGINRGYDEGRKHGEKDAKRGRDFNFHHDDRYRDADTGYRSHYGSRSVYVRAFRRGYEEGYRESYRAHSYDRGHRRDDRYGRDRDGRDERYDRDGRSDRYDNVYDWQSDGRHHHRGISGWCNEDHGYYGERGRVTREIPRRW